MNKAFLIGKKQLRVVCSNPDLFARSARSRRSSLRRSPTGSIGQGDVLTAPACVRSGPSWPIAVIKRSKFGSLSVSLDVAPYSPSCSPVSRRGAPIRASREMCSMTDSIQTMLSCTRIRQMRSGPHGHVSLPGAIQGGGTEGRNADPDEDIQPLSHARRGTPSRSARRQKRS